MSREEDYTPAKPSEFPKWDSVEAAGVDSLAARKGIHNSTIPLSAASTLADIDTIAIEYVLLNVAVDNGDTVGFSRALVDLVRASIGVARSRGLPWEALWFATQREFVGNSKGLPGCEADIAGVLKHHGWEPVPVAGLEK